MASEEHINNDGISRYVEKLGEGFHLSYEVLASYHYSPEVLSGRERGFIKRHLGECSECRGKLEEIEGFEAKAVSGKVFTMPVWTRYAAAAVIIITLGVSVYFLQVDRHETPVAVTEDTPATVADTVLNAEPEQKPEKPKIKPPVIKKPVKKPELLAADFAVNPLFEGFVDQRFRGAESVKQAGPKNGDTLTTGVVLSWSGAGPDDAYEVVVMDNKGQTVAKKEVTGSHAKIDDRLRNGLFYWKLSYGGNLIFVGKFFIVN